MWSKAMTICCLHCQSERISELFIVILKLFSRLHLTRAYLHMINVVLWRVRAIAVIPQTETAPQWGEVRKSFQGPQGTFGDWVVFICLCYPDNQCSSTLPTTKAIRESSGTDTCCISKDFKNILIIFALKFFKEKNILCIYLEQAQWYKLKQNELYFRILVIMFSHLLDY